LDGINVRSISLKAFLYPADSFPCAPFARSDSSVRVLSQLFTTFSPLLLRYLRISVSLVAPLTSFSGPLLGRRALLEMRLLTSCVLVLAVQFSPSVNVR
jgi:hypothetical protein